MTEFDELNKAKYIFLQDIQEMDGNGLEFTVFIGKAVEEDVSVDIANNQIGPVNEIIHDENSTRYKIKFNNYIAYSILNESYDSVGDQGEFEGGAIRKYSASNFLDYIKKDTFANQVFKEPLHHYFFYTQDHLINVASIEAPIIERISV